MASTNALLRNGARQCKNRYSWGGHRHREMERTWALTTADLRLKAASSVELERWHLVHRAIDNSDRLGMLWVLCALTSSVLPDTQQKREMGRRGWNDLPTLRAHRLESEHTLNSSLQHLSVGTPHTTCSSHTSARYLSFLSHLPPQKWTIGFRYNVTLMSERCEGSGSRSNGPFGPQTHCWPRKDEGVRIRLPCPWGQGRELQPDQHWATLEVSVTSWKRSPFSQYV